MPPTKCSTTTVEINGFAVREIRSLLGVGVAPLAEQVTAMLTEAGHKNGLTRSYLAKIELGHSTRVSPQVFAALIAALKLSDRRALLAHPHPNPTSVGLTG